MAQSNFYTDNFANEQQTLVSLEDQRKLYTTTQTDIIQNEKIITNETVNIKQSLDIEGLKESISSLEEKVDKINSEGTGGGSGCTCPPDTGIYDAGTF